MLRRYFSSYILAILVLFSSFGLVEAQRGSLRADYAIEVKSAADHLFHVTTTITNIRQPQLTLALPTWTPGWYTVENYYRNVLRFKITDPQGNPVRHTMIRKQTWSVETAGRPEIRIEFDYEARVLALNQAKISKDFAFFTGTQLFLEVVGNRKSPSTVKFVAPTGWSIVSALKETSDPTVFTASDYDTLVDSPTEMGRFDVTKFDVGGKPHYFVATPAGAFSAEKSKKFTEMMAKAFAAQSRIFGGLPYEKYVTFYFFARPESNAGGALEHNNSFVAFAPDGSVAQPEWLIGTASHEFFHLWNVKRIRPREMWPYDYSREQETPLLWVSEGFTNYYGSLATFRAGLRTREQFLTGVAGAISGVEGSEARAFISPVSSSVSTWVGYDSPVAFGISYYTQGQNLGALLDLSIINDTNGRAGLDDVMRALYREHFLRGRGFSTDEMIAIVNRISRRDYREFYRRYVFGLEVPDYDRVLGYAGYQLEKSSQKLADIGISASFGPEGIRITGVRAGSGAASAGMTAGDILVSVNGIDAARESERVFRSFSENIGQTVKVVVKRGGREVPLDMQIGARDETRYAIREVEKPTEQQMRIRAKWLATPVQ